ncbi:MAG: hypothetical protein RMJ66_01360 [Bacteroidia bacterium]|nr:hypothetical protein [Bacteroidia bacterium]MDW8133692.1 hypothetical protein [Bacteroidia bacterium]
MGGNILYFSPMFWLEEEGEPDVEELRRQFEQQSEEGPGYYTLRELERLIQWYLRHGETQKARQVIKHGSHLYPDSAHLNMWWSWLAYEERRYVEAYVHGMNALEEMPPSPELYAYLMQVCALARRPIAAKQVWERWWEDFPAWEERRRASAFLAETLIRLRMYKEAISYLWSGWLIEEKNSLYFPRRLAFAYRAAGEVEMGIWDFYNYLWHSPKEVELWLGLAQLYIYKLAYRQALQALEEAEELLVERVESLPSYWAFLYRLRAQVYEAQGCSDEAYRCWLHARHYHPTHLLTLCRLLDYYYQAKDYEGGMPYLRRLVKRGTHSPRVRRQIADFLWEAGRLEEALPYYKSLMSKKAHQREVVERLLLGYYGLQQYKSLKHLLEQIAREFQGDWAKWTYWVQKILGKSQGSLALLLTSYTLRIHQRQVPPSFYYWHAVAALQANELRLALWALEQGLLKAPNEINLFLSFFPASDDLPLPVRLLIKRYVGGQLFSA